MENLPGSRRHTNLLTWAGALIVFLSFIVNEVLRNNLSGLTGLIASAENSYVELGRLGIVLVKIDGLEQEVIELKPDNPIRANGEGASRLESNWTELSAAELELENVTAVAELLPKNRAQIASFENLRSRLSQLKTKQADLIATTIRDDTAIVQLTTNTNILLAEIRTLASEIVAAAKKIRGKKEEQYKIWTWVSYALYALGWGLSLYARDVNEVPE